MWPHIDMHAIVRGGVTATRWKKVLAATAKPLVGLVRACTGGVIDADASLAHVDADDEASADDAANGDNGHAEGKGDDGGDSDDDGDIDNVGGEASAKDSDRDDAAAVDFDAAACAMVTALVHVDGDDPWRHRDARVL